LYDRELQKRNALQALRLIEQGWKVGEAIRECHTSYSSIYQFGYKGTGRQMPRKTIRKVEECIKRVEAGEKLKSVLREMRLGAWSYYRYKRYFPNQYRTYSNWIPFFCVGFCVLFHLHQHQSHLVMIVCNKVLLFH